MNLKANWNDEKNQTAIGDHVIVFGGVFRSQLASALFGDDQIGKPVPGLPPEIANQIVRFFGRIEWTVVQSAGDRFSVSLAGAWRRNFFDKPQILGVRHEANLAVGLKGRISEKPE